MFNLNGVALYVAASTVSRSRKKPNRLVTSPLFLLMGIDHLFCALNIKHFQKKCKLMRLHPKSGKSSQQAGVGSRQ